MHFITANISGFSPSILSSFKYFPGPSTDNWLALILNGRSSGKSSNSLTSSFVVMTLYRKENLLTFSVLVGMSEGKISKPFLEVLQSNVLPMLKVGTAYAGIFIVDPRNKISSKLVTESYFVYTYLAVNLHVQGSTRAYVKKHPLK